MPGTCLTNMRLPPDTILVECTDSAYVQDIQPPPSNQAQGLPRGRKRYYQEITRDQDTSDQAREKELAAQVKDLKEQLKTQKRVKVLEVKVRRLKKQMSKSR
jgi:hypothetical protein